MQDPSPNQEQVCSRKLLDYKTGIEEQDKRSRGRSLSPSCVRASNSCTWPPCTTCAAGPRLPLCSAPSRKPRRAEVWCQQRKSFLSIIPSRGTAPRQSLAPSRWESSSPSSAGHSHHAGMGFGCKPAEEPSSPHSSHPHRSGHTVQGELCRRVRDGQAPPHLPGCFPGTQDPSDHIQKPLDPDANASQNGYWRIIPALGVSSCSWDRHPGNNLGRRATPEHQHRRRCAESPRDDQSFSPLSTSGHGNPRPPPGEHTWGPPHGSPDTAAGTSSHLQDWKGRKKNPRKPDTAAKLSVTTADSKIIKRRKLFTETRTQSPQKRGAEDGLTGVTGGGTCAATRGWCHQRGAQRLARLRTAQPGSAALGWSSAGAAHKSGRKR